MDRRDVSQPVRCSLLHANGGSYTRLQASRSEPTYQRHPRSSATLRMPKPEGPYFITERNFPFRVGRLWHADATIRRTDTDEKVSHLSETGDTAEQATSKMEQTLLIAIDRLSRPEDWGRDSTVPRLIQGYLAKKEQAISVATRARLQSESAESWESEFKQRWNIVEKWWRGDFALKLAELRDEHLLDLVTPTTGELENPLDPWIVDQTSARCELFGLIKSPKPELQRAFEEMKRRYEKAVLDRQNGAGMQ